MFKITANAVPITVEDSRAHNYGLRGGDCLAHLDLAFRFYSLTDDVHGVLGQTYRSSYVNRLDVSARMPVMGGERAFAASGLCRHRLPRRPVRARPQCRRARRCLGRAHRR